MPLDSTNFEIETKTDPFTVEAFRDWLEEQVRLGRGEEEYCFTDRKRCLLTQYGHSIGETRVSGTPNYPSSEHSWCTPKPMYQIALGTHFDSGRTFSAALARANAYLEEH